MRISELARQAGVWVEDVELLLHRELLPPVASGSFGEHHLNALRLVTEMRSVHRLSLNTIQAILAHEYQYDVSRAERALLAYVEPDPGRAGAGPLTRDQLLESTELPPGTLEALVERQLVPEVGPYGGHHVWLCEAVHQLLESGVSAALLEDILDIAESVGKSEAGLAVQSDSQERMVYLSGVRARRRMVGQLRGRGRFVGQRRRLGLLTLAAGQAGTLASVRFYRPSPLFRVRHGVETIGCSSGDDPFRVGRLALGLGRLDEASRLLEQSLREGIGPYGKVCATLGVVRALQGDASGSRNAIFEALDAEPNHAVVTGYAALSLAISAPSTTSSLQSAAWMEASLSLLSRSRSGIWQDEGEMLEAALARGRLGLVVPHELGHAETSRADLELVLKHTQGKSENSAGQLERQLLRLNALYFLGMDLDDRGLRNEARTLLVEVAWIDPTSEFARQSWLRLQQPQF
ncbi:MAG: MerR family transcriptional regulator [Myxococcota bacterium]|nr:MerR family transcriptional regulator [Myxococcota bacterium]